MRKGITPQGYYINKNGESIHYQSGYEHKFMIYLDEHNFNWIKCKERFPYFTEDGKKHTYNPDFYLPDFDLYVETKGMIRKKDPLKFEAFPKDKNLLLLESSDLKMLGLDVFEPDLKNIDKTKWPFTILKNIDDFTEIGILSDELKQRLSKYKYIFNLEN